MITLVLSCADYNLLDDNNPPPAAALAVSNVRDSTITIRWLRCNDENYASYSVYCDTNDVVDKGSIFVDSLLFAGDTVKSISNLKPATLYFARVFTRNIQGKESGSNIVSAITQITFRKSVIFDSIISIFWTPLHGVSYSSCTIYRDTANTIDTVDDIKTPADSTLQLYKIPLGKTERFRVIVSSDSGVLVTSNRVLTVNGRWFDQYPPAGQGDTVVLSWPRQLPNVKTYTVFSGQSGSVDTSSLVLAENVTDTIRFITGLTRGSTTYFRIYAKSDTGYVGSSPVKKYTVP